MKKTKSSFLKIGLLLLGAFSVLGLSSCSSTEVKTYSTLSDFKGTKIGILTGTVYEDLLNSCADIGEGNYNGITYSSTSDEVKALLNDKIDCFVTDEPVARMICAKNSKLACFEDFVAEDAYGALFCKNSEFYQPVSSLISQYIADGTIETLRNKWIYQIDGTPKVNDITSYNPDYDPTLTNKTLKVTGMCTQQPFCYMDGKTNLGLDVEMFTMIAATLNYNITFDCEYASFTEIIPSLKSGQYDVMIGGVSYTDERAKEYKYTPIYYTAGATLVYKKVSNVYREIADIDGKKIGCLIGSTPYLAAIKDYLPTTYEKDQITYYQSLAHCKIALQSGYIEGYIDEYASAKYYENLTGNISILDDVSSQLDYGFLYSNSESCEDLKKQVDSYINGSVPEISDTSFESLYNSWVYSSEKYGPIDTSKYPSDGSGGTIRVGAFCEAIPMSYIADDKTNTGFEVELLYAIASKYNYKLEFHNYTFSSLITAISEGTVDIMIGNTILNDERKASFTYSIYGKASIVLVVKNVEATNVGFFEKIKNSFYNNFIKGDRYKFILEGLGITLVVSFFSILGATILGIILCFLRMRKNPFVSKLSKWAIAIIEGVPILLILLLFYHIVFAGLDLSSIFISSIAFSIGFMPYYAEVFRSGIQSISKGQIEAAKATGFSKSQITRKIMFPQVVSNCLPVYLGECVSSLKMTSIVGYIGLMDLTRASDLIQSLTFDALFPLISVSLIYLLLSLGLTYLFKLFAKLIGKKDFSKHPLRTKDNFFDKMRRKKHIEVENSYDSDVVISIKNLTKIYDNKLEVLSNVNVDIHKGDIVSIIGPSGTGKSTFIRCINDLESCTEGEILINGHSNKIEKKDKNSYKNDTQMVFQSFNLWSHLSIIENIVLGPIYINCMPRNEAYELALELLEKVGLRSKAYSYPDELSGGQAQRVAIARALAMKPQIILFDEPTSALDPAMIGEVLKVIKTLAKESNITMLIVTHEMKFAKDVSNRVFFMEQKGIYEDNTPQVIFTNPSKELTRQFINQSHIIQCNVKKYEMDYPKLCSEITSMLSNYILDERFVNRAVLAFEEILIHSLYKNANTLNIKVECMEKTETVLFEIDYDEDFDPLNSFEDDVSKKIFDNTASEIKVSNNRITFKAKR